MSKPANEHKSGPDWKSILFLVKFLEERCLVSYQDEETVGGEVLMSRDGGEHGEDQAAEHQDEPENNEREGDILNLERHRHCWMGWHPRSFRPARPHLQRFRKMHQSQQCADWEARLCFPLRQTLEPVLTLEENQNNLAAQSQSWFPPCSEPWARPFFNFLRYQVNRNCLRTMISQDTSGETDVVGKQATSDGRHAPWKCTIFFPPSHKSSRNTSSFETQTWGLRF